MNLESIHINSGDMIVVRYDSDNTTNTEAHAIMAYVKDKFPNNDVIVLPRTIDMELIDRDKVENFLETIRKECGLTNE